MSSKKITVEEVAEMVVSTFCDDYAVAFDMAIEALEKQIPKKPEVFVDKNIHGYTCPTCGLLFLKCQRDFELPCRCGQLIDWSEEE